MLVLYIKKRMVNNNRKDVNKRYKNINNMLVYKIEIRNIGKE